MASTFQEIPPACGGVRRERGSINVRNRAAAQHPRTIISEISEIGISSLQHSKKHQIDPPQLEVSKMRTVFIALGLVAATLAAPLAGVQETGSLADEPSPHFANTQQYPYGRVYGGTGEKRRYVRVVIMCLTCS